MGFLAVVLSIEHNNQFHLWVSLCTGVLLLWRPFWPPGGWVTKLLSKMYMWWIARQSCGKRQYSIFLMYFVIQPFSNTLPIFTRLISSCTLELHMLGFWTRFSWCTSASAPSLLSSSSSSSTSSVSESSWPRLVLCSLCFNGHYITRQQFRRLKDLFSHQSSIGLWKHKLSPILPRWALYIFILLVNNFAVLKVFIIILSIIIQ